MHTLGTVGGPGSPPDYMAGGIRRFEGNDFLCQTFLVICIVGVNAVGWVTESHAACLYKVLL